MSRYFGIVRKRRMECSPFISLKRMIEPSCGKTAHPNKPNANYKSELPKRSNLKFTPAVLTSASATC